MDSGGTQRRTLARSHPDRKIKLVFLICSDPNPCGLSLMAVFHSFVCSVRDGLICILGGAGQFRSHSSQLLNLKDGGMAEGPSDLG